MYAPELTQLFIDERLQDYEVVTEWNLLDIIAIEKHRDTWFETTIPKVHVYEVKSSHDNEYRIFEQLPEYLWLADTATLILGKGVKIPKRLPKWLGIIKYRGKTFEDIHIPTYKPYRTDETFRGRKGIYIAKYALPNNLSNSSDAPDWSFFTRFLKKGYVNSILGQKGKEKYCEYTLKERALIKYLKKVGRIRIYEKEYATLPLQDKALDDRLKTLTLDDWALEISEESKSG